VAALTSVISHQTDLIPPSTSVRDIGVFIDRVLSMISHVHKITGIYYSVLRQLRNVRRSFSAEVFRMLVRSLVVSWLYYCNAALAGNPMNILRRVQSVMNTAARTIADLPRFPNISLSVASHHWLRAPERISFKLALLMVRMHGTAPSYSPTT
jgi:hypothetical protein